MREYDCSRMTVNKALSALNVAGFIERRKRAGTFVARPKVQSLVLDIPDLASEVIGRGQTYQYRLLQRRERHGNPERETEARLVGSGRLLQIDGVHLADGVPLALEFRLVSLEAVPEFKDLDFSQEAPGTWLLHHVPWTEAESRISAVSTKGDEGKRLQVPPHTACLSVERWTWRGSDPVTYVRQLFVGSGYNLIARFRSSANMA